MAQDSDELTTPRVVQFQRDIAPIFRRHCLECHGVENPKNDFRIDDAETVISYLEPGDLESSFLYTDYLMATDPDLAMPPASRTPLSAAELALIRVWIEEGAVWPEGEQVSDESKNVSSATEAIDGQKSKRSLPERVWMFQGFMHPATVHFPIALFVVGALFVVLGVRWPNVGTQVPLACLLLGSISAIASTVMGWSFAIEQGYGSWTKASTDNVIFWHRWGGLILTIVSVIVSVVAVKSVKSGNPRSQRMWKCGLLFLAIAVGLVGHQGGEMSYGEDFYPKAFRILFDTPEQDIAE